MHKCAVAHYINEFVHEDDFQRRITSALEEINTHNRAMFKAYGEPKHSKEITRKQFLDQRSGYITLFNYCPHCGTATERKGFTKNETNKD